MTRALLPAIQDATKWTTRQLRAISVGVNKASATPDVPLNEPFIWRDERSNAGMVPRFKHNSIAWVARQSSEFPIYFLGITWTTFGDGWISGFTCVLDNTESQNLVDYKLMCTCPSKLAQSSLIGCCIESIDAMYCLICLMISLGVRQRKSDPVM